MFGNDIIKNCPEIVKEINHLHGGGLRCHRGEGNDVREVDSGVWEQLRYDTLAQFQLVSDSPKHS